MKKLLVIIALALPLLASAQKFGHVNTQEVFKMMPEQKNVQEQLDALQKQYEDMLVSMQNEIKEKADKYDQEAANLTDTQKQIREEELYTMQQRLQTTYQTAQQEVQQKQQELIVPLQEKLIKAIEAVGKEKGFTYIFDNSAMMYVSPDALDCTADVKAKLGIK